VLNDLPPDQSALILERLGARRVAEIEKEAKGVTSFYNLCIRAMGENRGGNKYTRMPTATQAWIEVAHNIGNWDEPEFSHVIIEKAIENFGGWKKMVSEFAALSLRQSRLNFLAAYRGVTE